MSDLLKHFGADEVLRDDGRAFGFSIHQRGESFLFGPKSPSRVKFKRGLLPKGQRLRRIGELISEGLSDYQVHRRIEEEFRGRNVSRRTIEKMRIVVEDKHGPFLCRCGQHVNHPRHCAHRRHGSGANRVLSAEAVVDIRTRYQRRGEWTLLKLAQKWGVSQSTVSDIVRNGYHKPVRLLLAQFKAKMYLGQLEKVHSPIARLQEARAAAPLTGPREQLFDDQLNAALELIEQAITQLWEAGRVRAAHE